MVVGFGSIVRFAGERVGGEMFYKFKVKLDTAQVVTGALGSKNVILTNKIISQLNQTRDQLVIQ